MKPVDLRKKTKEELRDLLKEKKRHLDELRFMLHQKKIKNVKESYETRKDIARILTLLNPNAQT